MSTLSQFTGGAKVPKVLINSTSTTGSTAAFVVNSATLAMGKSVLSGVCTAGVLKTIYSASGSGVVSWFACNGVDATSRTHRIKCTIDGVVVYDATTAAVAATDQGINLIGITSNVPYIPGLDPIPYNTSFLVEYATSISETDKTRFGYLARTN